MAFVKGMIDLKSFKTVLKLGYLKIGKKILKLDMISKKIIIENWKKENLFLFLKNDNNLGERNAIRQ